MNEFKRMVFLLVLLGSSVMILAASLYYFADFPIYFVFNMINVGIAICVISVSTLVYLERSNKGDVVFFIIVLILLMVISVSLNWKSYNNKPETPTDHNTHIAELW